MGEVDRLRSNVAKDAAAMQAMGVLVEAKALKLDIHGKYLPVAWRSHDWTQLNTCMGKVDCNVAKDAAAMQAMGVLVEAKALKLDIHGKHLLAAWHSHDWMQLDTCMGIVNGNVTKVWLQCKPSESQMKERQGCAGGRKGAHA